MLFVYLVGKIYNLTLEEAKKNHQLQQLEMAKAVAQGIDYFMQHLISDMKLLTNDPILNENNPERVYSALKYFQKNYDTTIIKSIFLTDTSASILYSTGASLPTWTGKVTDSLYQSIRKDKGRSDYILSRVIPQNDYDEKASKLFLIIKKLTLKDQNNKYGYIGYLVNFDYLIEKYIKPLKLSSDDFAWILDEDGRLIYHPRHQEMLFRSILKTSKKCSSCHVSFKTQYRMLKTKKGGMDEYYVLGDEPYKIMAYYPVKVKNQFWIIAITTFLPKVTAGLQEKFRLFFLLGIVILGVILILGFSIYYLNLKRIRAEDARRNLEQIQQYQEQLNHASKLASIGELVDSVAHEINTPAGIIAAHTDALKLENNRDNNIDEELNIIRRQIRRISDYTKTLLTFSQRMPYNPELLNVNELINECIYLVGHRIRANKINIIKRFNYNLPLITADKRQMEQVIINILNNAIDVLNSNGEIVISTFKKMQKGKLLSPDSMKEIHIKIEDNGPGIKKEFIDKIFSPFFSTKLNLNGTGLGLSISKSIIQKHKGKIEVSSKEGKGTKFTIILPLNIKGN